MEFSSTSKAWPPGLSPGTLSDQIKYLSTLCELWELFSLQDPNYLLFSLMDLNSTHALISSQQKCKRASSMFLELLLFRPLSFLELCYAISAFSLQFLFPLLSEALRMCLAPSSCAHWNQAANWGEDVAGLVCFLFLWENLRITVLFYCSRLNQLAHIFCSIICLPQKSKSSLWYSIRPESRSLAILSVWCQIISSTPWWGSHLCAT